MEKKTHNVDEKINYMVERYIKHLALNNNNQITMSHHLSRNLHLQLALYSELNRKILLQAISESFEVSDYSLCLWQRVLNF